MENINRNRFCAFFLVSLTLAKVALASDTDSDGMDDLYEQFFGLSYTNAADASLDPDGDSVTNLQESILWTDPLVPDTDQDGWPDNLDASPVSRAAFLWGDPQFTQSNSYFYTFPAWCAGGFRNGGLWTSNGWEAASGLPENSGALNIEVDRSLLTNNAMLDVELFDATNASLYVSLYDTNLSPIVDNLYGNLMQSSEEEVTRRLSIPFAAYSNAAVVSLKRGIGDVAVYGCLMYIDMDMDGLDADQEVQLSTSDTNLDSDGDGVFDYSETFIRLTDPADSQSVNITIYANSDSGSDTYNGCAPIYEGGNIGPKHSIQDALEEAVTGDAIELNGVSAFDENILSAHGKQITLKAAGNITVR